MEKTTDSDHEPRPADADGETEKGLRPYHGELVEDIIEAEFTDQAPAYASKANDLIEKVKRGQLTIGKAISMAEGPVREIIAAFSEVFKLPKDVERDFRRARITQQLIDPASDVALHSAIKLSQAEENLSGDKADRRVSPETQATLKRLLREKEEEKAKGALEREDKE